MHPNKNPVLETFLEEVVGIADKEYQMRVWIRGEGPEVDDFDEAVCRYSDAADSIFEEYTKCNITSAQLKLIKKFHEKFKKFWKSNDLPQQFIDTPEWTELTLMAREVLLTFDYQQDREC